MVTTRAGAARARQEVQDSQSQLSSPISPTPSLIESSDGHRYDISAFDNAARRRAKIGLMGHSAIRMQFCKEVDDGTRYQFHLDDDITVDIREGRAPKCSCGATDGEKACKVGLQALSSNRADSPKHVFWMLGQLTSKLPTTVEAINLAEDGSSVRGKHPADIIKRFSLEQIAGNLDWVYEDDQWPEYEELVDEMADMLSVFEPTKALPDEFKNEDARELSTDSRKYRDFKAVLTQHAQRYPAFYLQLQEIVSSEFQVQVFFDKINNRIDRAFRALDEYIAKGPTNARSEALDVDNCAARLRELVQAIGNYYGETLESAEERDNYQVEILAVASLVRILDEVTKRNLNAYATSTWGMPSTDPKENNLFVRLIRPAGDDRDLFVLGTLLSLAHEDALRDHVVVLLDVDERLRATPYTPPEYMAAFRKLTQEGRKRAPS